MELSLTRDVVRISSDFIYNYEYSNFGSKIMTHAFLLLSLFSSLSYSLYLLTDN